MYQSFVVLKENHHLKMYTKDETTMVVIDEEQFMILLENPNIKQTFKLIGCARGKCSS